MTDDRVRCLAYRARRHGWSARDLAAQSDPQWERTRIVLGADDVSNVELGEMVALILSWELSEAQYGLDTASTAGLVVDAVVDVAARVE